VIIPLSEPDIQEAVERHAARNRDLKKLIENKGVDLAGRRFIDLRFWAFGEEAAKKLALALHTEGFSPVSKKASASDSTLWNVETQLEASPLSVSTAFFVERMVRLAAEKRRRIRWLGNISLTPAAQQALAADGAIACFSINLFPFSLNADRAPQLKRSVRRLRYIS
jgi:hypothetical protein